MMKPKQTEYDRKSRDAKRKRGLVRVEVWVPADKREALIAIAREMRERTT